MSKICKAKHVNSFPRCVFFAKLGSRALTYQHDDGRGAIALDACIALAQVKALCVKAEA